MDISQVTGIAAGICTSTALMPQLVVTLRKKKAADVSLAMYIVLLVGNSLWIIYGFMKNDLPVIATNIFSTALNIAMLILKLKYQHKSDS